VIGTLTHTPTTTNNNNNNNTMSVSSDETTTSDDLETDDLTDHASLAKQAATVQLFFDLRAQPTMRDVAHVQALWRRYFEPLNLATHPCAHKDGTTRQNALAISYTDMGFIALCRMWDHASRAAGATGQWIADTHMHLVSIASQHTPASRDYWPPADEWAALKARVARVVCLYMDTGPRGRVRLIEQLQESEFKPIDDAALVARYQECRNPQTLQDHVERLRRKAEAARIAGKREDEIKEDASIEAAGSLWRNTPDDLINNYVRIASRTVRKVDLDNELVHTYRTTTLAAPEFNRWVFEGAHQWVRAKCGVEQTEEMTKLFRDTANRWWCPMGAETDRFRDKATRTDTTAPLQVLEMEIGIDMSQHLHDRSLAKLVTIASERCVFWDALFLSLFQYYMMQSMRLDFTRDYVLYDAHTRAAQERMRRLLFLGKEKRPVVVRLQRRWWIHHQQQLVLCEHGLVHAILAWLLILDTWYDRRTENGNRLDGAIAVFFASGVLNSLVPTTNNKPSHV